MRSNKKGRSMSRRRRRKDNKLQDLKNLRIPGRFVTWGSILLCIFILGGGFYNLLENPFTVIGSALAAACYFACPEETEWEHTACVTVKIISELADVISNIENTLKSL